MLVRDAATVRCAADFDLRIVTRERPLSALSLLVDLLRSRTTVLVSAFCPLTDPVVCRQLVSLLHEQHALLAAPEAVHEFAPLAVVRSSLLLRALPVRAVKRQNVSLLGLVRALAGRERIAKLPLKRPASAACFRSETITPAALEAAGGAHSSLDDVLLREETRELNAAELVEKSRGRLHEAMLASVTPWHENLRLALFEVEHNLDEVLSFPFDVGLSLTNRCNANCAFCDYEAVRGGEEQAVSLDDVREMTFLKYAGKLGFGGATGEPLVAPGFTDIWRYVRTTYPHLRIRIITNGLGLGPKLIEQFAGELTRIRVSLNAATRDTYRELMGVDAFDRVCASIRSLAETRERLGSRKPEILLLTVVSRRNVNELPAFAELAASLGADGVGINHFSPESMPLCRLPRSASMFYDRDRFDEQLGRALARAGELGLRVEEPPLLFREGSGGHYQGARVRDLLPYCGWPWLQCILARDSSTGAPRLEVCCAGLDAGISYLPDRLTEGRFHHTWNQPALKYMRRSANQLDTDNPMCRYCRSQEHADPENAEVAPARHAIRERIAALQEP